MLFSSFTFVWFFLPAPALIYYISPGRKLRNGVLLITSLVLHSWGEPWHVVLVILFILLNYGLGLALDGCGERRGPKRVVFALNILADLGLLGYFKYPNSFLGLAMSPLGCQGFTPRNIALPTGISLYTFQSISYLTDTLRGEGPVQRNVFHLALYISLFLQILSGSTVKHHELKPQIRDRQENLSIHVHGIKRFVYGLVKKVASANMFGQVVDRMSDLPLEQLGTTVVWLAVIPYSFQICYDSSGYPDMAIGLDRTFSFICKENLNYLYLSASVSEFWRRWHISLSTWFRQYLYIPLGGSRKGLARTCVNLFLVFLVAKLWHGTGMDFICWGVYYGILIVTEQLWSGRILKENPLKFLNRLYTLGAVVVGWLLFRMNTLHNGKILLKAILIPNRGLWNPRIFVGNRILFLLVLAVVFCGLVQQLMPRFKVRLFDEENITAADMVVMAALLLLGTLLVISSTHQVFIYFRF